MDKRATAPQNLELGQIDLIKTQDLSDRWPQGGGSLNPGLEANQGQVEARIVGRRQRRLAAQSLAGVTCQCMVR